jgi:ABC-2 type transport system permease protein
MGRYLRLYGWFMLQRFKILLEYRLNFIVGAASTIFLQAAGILSIWVVMLQVPTLNGWTYDELLLVYGLILLSKSINHMFADNLWTVGSDYIRTGNFDRFLVRPVDPLFHLLADRFCHDGLGTFAMGLALVVKAAVALGIAWTPHHIAYLVVAVLSGGTIFIALNLLTAASAFWVIDSRPITLTVFQTHEFAKYPLSLYGKGVSTVMTWLIPYGFASFYPASYVLGRDIGLLAWAGPIVATLLLLLSYRVWLYGLSHYAGTGS